MPRRAGDDNHDTPAPPGTGFGEQGSGHGASFKPRGRNDDPSDRGSFPAARSCSAVPDGSRRALDGQAQQVAAAGTSVRIAVRVVAAGRVRPGHTAEICVNNHHVEQIGTGEVRTREVAATKFTPVRLFQLKSFPLRLTEEKSTPTRIVPEKFVPVTIALPSEASVRSVLLRSAFGWKIAPMIALVCAA